MRAPLLFVLFWARALFCDNAPGGWVAAARCQGVVCCCGRRWRCDNVRRLFARGRARAFGLIISHGRLSARNCSGRLAASVAEAGGGGGAGPPPQAGLGSGSEKAPGAEEAGGGARGQAQAGQISARARMMASDGMARRR